MPAALADWYSIKNYQQWAMRYPCENIDRQNSLLAAQQQYMDFIQYTPTFFVNGYQLPEQYEIKDLEKMVLQMVEKI